jgi:hypothetical protein
MRRVNVSLSKDAGQRRWDRINSDLVQVSGLARARSSVGEHPLHTRGVVGSSPTVPISRETRGAVAQLVRAPPCHGGGRGFEPHQRRHFYPDFIGVFLSSHS